MFNLIIRNLGFLVFAMVLVIVSNDYQEHTAAIRQNTAQIASAVTCKSDAKFDHVDALNILASDINKGVAPVMKKAGFKVIKPVKIAGR